MFNYGLHLPLPNTSVQETKWQQFFTTPFKKLPIFPHNIPFLGCFSQLPSFRKDIGPCVTIGVSVLTFYTTWMILMRMAWTCH